MLTYEFDDQQLINLIAGRRLDDEFDLRKNQLRFIAACQPLVIYDSRKTRESNKLPHFLDLVPVRANAYSCHHSKAYLIVTANTVRLVLGSFNLTQSGLFSNREVFMDFMWSVDERENAGLLRSFVDLLRNGYRDQPRAAASSALDSTVSLLEGRIQKWKMSVDGDDNAASMDTYVLLTSGYEHRESGLKQLTRLWQTVSDRPPRKLIAVSPFFDRGSSFLVDALNEQLGPIPEIHLHTDADNVLCLSKRHYGRCASTRRLHLIPNEISDEELMRIQVANDGAAIENLSIKRKLHAKILVLCGEGQRHLIYIGSANFTAKAWNGDNHELGLAWVQQGSADAVVAPVIRALGSMDACEYEQLQEGIEQVEIEADVLYEDLAGYPDFIRAIELRSPDDMETVSFHFSCDQPDRLRDYEIYWGDVAIDPAGAVSQPIPWNESAIPLLGKRNLRFVQRGFVEPVFYLPFHYTAELLAYSELKLFAAPEDWLLYYLRPQYEGGGEAAEHIPGEQPEPEDASDVSVDREGNLVIAMQRYLSLFAQVERVFEERVSTIAKCPDRAEQWARQVEKPLVQYAQLLDKEYEASASALRDQVYSFKLGELVLFCHSLGIELPAMSDLARRLAAALTCQRTDANVLRIYLEFCRSELE